MHNSYPKLLAALVVMALISSIGLADPCGMVPPIYTGNVSPITRIGLQKTYVFHKNGVETFVIRPGFSGKLDNFGMLIPFPNPPELRKVPDSVFEQVANAVDPPEVVIDLRQKLMMRTRGAVPMSAMAEKSLDFEDQVTVLKQEAVGMYEVAVLEAGSANALKLWMDEHGYQYPAGMDKVTNEYVESGWCFVAVKTRVGKKEAIQPRPGQRDAQNELPDGSVFDGNVQAMGFRFKTDKLAVPMRLSAFNAGETRNVLYLLTDGPRRINSIPEEYVMRQISGQELFDNITKPLPLRIIGGTENDIPEYQRQSLPQQRDPEPKNGVAKELFAADLLAVASGNLYLEHEETEKEYLRIGEHFGLRGAEVDAVNLNALAEARKSTTEKGLEMVKAMTLTVVDGDFPREVVAKENLTFTEYKMPAEKNNNFNYDSNLFGPGTTKEGILKVGTINWNDVNRQIVQEHCASKMALRIVLGIALLGVVVTLVPRKPKLMLLVLLGFGLLVGSALAENRPLRSAVPDQLIDKLENSKTAAAAIEAIKERAKSSDDDRESMLKELLAVVTGDASLPKRGWAIAAMAEIGGQDVDEYLLNVHADVSQPMLVRTWAAAARVATTRTVNGLIEKANLIAEFPALGRPIGMRIIEKMTTEDDKGDPEKIMEVTQQVPQLQASLAPAIMAFGSEKLSHVMIHGGNDEVRRIAAGYIGALAGQGESADVVAKVNSDLRFDASAEDVPWKGGALFIPGIQWNQDDARLLVGNLMRWNLWCDINGKTAELQQIHNNIRSIGLANAAGYRTPDWNVVEVNAWLVAWGEAVGKHEVEAILQEQKVADNSKYSRVLRELK